MFRYFEWWLVDFGRWWVLIWWSWVVSGSRLWVVRCTYVTYGIMLNVILKYIFLMCQMLRVFFTREGVQTFLSI